MNQVIVEVETEDGPVQLRLPISKDAAELIRLNFNPSKNVDVSAIKHLTGALITLINEVGVYEDDIFGPQPHQETQVAVAQIVTASMWAVLAATKEA